MSFALARDAFYATALLMGIAISLFARLWLTRRLHGALFTFNLFLFSSALLALTALVGVTRGAVFYDKALLLAALAVFALAALGGFFPLHAGFPLIALAGAALVWGGAVFWRYPPLPAQTDVLTNALDYAADGGSHMVIVRSGDLVPLFGGQLRCLPAQPVPGLLFREEYSRLSPSKNRLVFSFVAEKGIISRL